MRYLKLFEDSSNSKLELIKNIIKENQFLSKYTDEITDESLNEFDDYIYVELPNVLDSAHINKHFDKNNPGSIWSISKEEVSKLIVETLAKKPTKALQEGPTFKYKWLNLECAKPVGFDSLKKVDGDIVKEVDLEPFGMVERVKEWEKVDAVAKQNSYDLVAKDGDDTREYTEEDLKNNVPCFIKQEVGVVEGDKMQNPTKTYNLITAKVGEVEGKPVLTLMTVFPGLNPVDSSGKDITNKKDLATAGYALIKSKKTNESLNKLEVNESLPRQRTVDQWNRLRKMTKGVDIGDRISNLNKQGANIQYYRNVVDSGIESYEDFEKHNKKFIPSWNLKHLTSPFSGEGKKLKT